jgi:hypothetical protein
MKKRSGFLVLLVFLLLCYAYSLFLALWGHPLYSGRGDAGYLVAFHLLSVLTYLSLSIVLELFETHSSLKKPELIFVLHGSLITLFPYDGYQQFGAVVMAAALISLGIRGRK